MQETIIKNVLALNKKDRDNQIKKQIAKKIDGQANISNAKIDMQPFINNSVDAFTNLIKNQAASKLALKKLKYSFDKFGWIKNIFKRTSSIQAKTILSNWEYEIDFLSIRHELEKFLVVNGRAFLGYGIYKGMPYPFIANITELETDAITRKIIRLSYLINEIQLNGKIYSLEERWELDFDTQKYSVKRYLAKTDDSEKGRLPNIAATDYYRNEDALDFIQGELIFNNEDFASEIQWVMQFMRTHGEMHYWLPKKFKTMSAKVLAKEGISGKTEQQMEDEFENKTLINFSSRASQYQQPITPFTPVLPNQQIQDTINFYEDKIFVFSLASRATDSGKAAQTGNLETTLKNENANNYTEFKKHIRSQQLTKYMRKIAKVLKIEKANDLFVEVQISATQERLLDPNIDGAAQQQNKGGEPNAK